MLLESIPTNTPTGLRDRALISVMIYSFGRISAVIGLDVPDYHYHGARRRIRLCEKGGKEHSVPVHHRAEEYVDAYLADAGITAGPLFRATEHDRITERRLSRSTAWEMVKRRARAAGLPGDTTNHTFRATGITVYLENGGTIENARNIAAHAPLRTTLCYGRRGESVTLDEINRIQLWRAASRSVVHPRTHDSLLPHNAFDRDRVLPGREQLGSIGFADPGHSVPDEPCEQTDLRPGTEYTGVCSGSCCCLATRSRTASATNSVPLSRSSLSLQPLPATPGAPRSCPLRLRHG